MRRLCRWLLFLGGTALICVRLYPSSQEWVARLFHDDLVYEHAEALSLRLISISGLSLSLYGSHADNLTTLVQTVVVILEAVVIAFVFFTAARKL